MDVPTFSTDQPLSEAKSGSNLADKVLLIIARQQADDADFKRLQLAEAERRDTANRKEREEAREDNNKNLQLIVGLFQAQQTV